MKNNYYISFVVLISLVMGSCQANRFISSNFEEDSSKHESIAVLPVEMVLTGNMPKNMSEDEILEMEEYESLEFQASVYT